MLDALASICMKSRWVFLLTGLVICGITVLTCHRNVPTPLPAPVRARVERHLVQSAVDSAEIKRLTRSATAASVQKDSVVVRAKDDADRGDYRAAFVAEDTALLAIEREAALLDLALTRSESRAIDADSVIAAVLPIAESREPPCRIFLLIPCPTRRAVAAAAAAVTAVALIATPKLGRP
jgi:hypothetical protein